MTADMRPYTPGEIDRWAHNRRPHEREKIPHRGERVLFRETDFGPPVPAVVADVQDMTGTPHNHWNRHGGREQERGPGEPDVNVWRWDENERAWLLKDDPWPWVHLQVVVLGEDGSPRLNGDGEEILQDPRWCREARVRGSAGWLREGSRAHTGNYAEDGER